MIFISKKQIVAIDRLTIEFHGGNFVEPFNFLNEPALDYLVEVVPAELFVKPLYPTITDKAGVYLFNIVANHIFTDGNKRTGLETGLLFLKLNGYLLSQKISNPILTDFVLSVASGEQTLTNVQDWFKDSIVKK